MDDGAGSERSERSRREQAANDHDGRTTSKNEACGPPVWPPADVARESLRLRLRVAIRVGVKD